MKPKPFWLLNHFTIPLFTKISFRVHVRPGCRGIGAVCRLIDFLGKGSETCAPVSNEAKRPRSFGQVSIYIIWTRIGAKSRSAGPHLPNRLRQCDDLAALLSRARGSIRDAFDQSSEGQSSESQSSERALQMA